MTPLIICHMTNQRSQAIQHVEAVHVYRDHLRDLYASGGQDRGLVADLHQQIGTALKLADIHATLAVADAIRDLAGIGPLSGVR